MPQRRRPRAKPRRAIKPRRATKPRAKPRRAARPVRQARPVRAARPARAARPVRQAAPDWLRLAGIQAYGHLGVTSKERDLGQRVEADVEIAYEPSTRRRPDSLDAYVDYEELGRLVRVQIEMSRCKLIETLAEEVALALLEEFQTPRVRVRLRKLHVPVSGFSGVPEIVIERGRA
jgi:7,8-dihydroneopterin aldolase/epimerase/oxygenase